MLPVSIPWLIPVLALSVSCSSASNDDDDNDWGDNNAYGSSEASYDNGLDAYKHFPLDGSQREWLYRHPDKDFLLHVEKLPNPFVIPPTVHTLRYAKEDPWQLQYSIKWSSDADHGVQIHGYMVEEPTTDTGEESERDTGSTASKAQGWVVFQPPVQFATAVMAVGDQVQSSAAGMTFTSTLETIEGCPNDWRDDWSCIRLRIESNTISTSTPPPFLGTWHLATRFGTSLFQPYGANRPWRLVTADFVAD